MFVVGQLSFREIFSDFFPIFVFLLSSTFRYTCYTDGSNSNQIWEMSKAGFIRGGPDRTCLDFAPVSCACVQEVEV